MFWVFGQGTTGSRTNAPPGGKAAQGTNDLYRLGIGDILSVKVYREEDLSAQVMVNPDGMINLQLIGPIKVAGMTLLDVNQVVRDLYAKDFLVNPHVVVDIVETNRLPESAITNQVNHYIVLGQVNKPGTYELREGETVNLLQAIAIAGGYTRLGNPSKITVTRLEDGKPNVIKLDADKMLRDRSSKPFEIKPDDIITVGEKIF
ncbi:MAG: polysaccharide export protein [Verrucomicrobiae bacterium]|nr:polysaccharide export protein [Verrucomicrobiae bacterium]